MSRFGPDPLAFFAAVYSGTPPWDIGGPQPSMSALFDAYEPIDPVLDVGCGSGDVAIHLARMGRRVVGIDFVEAAVAQAQAKAAALPGDVASLLEFRVADATRPSDLGEAFGSIVDSGFLHLLDADESDGYIADVAAALRPCGRFYLHEFAVEYPIANVPRNVSESELRVRFTAGNGWRILDIRPAEFQSRVAAPAPAIAAVVERLPSRG